MRSTSAKVLTTLIAAVAIAACAAAPAHAQAQFDARYTLTMSGMTLGKLSWRAELGTTDYTLSASGAVSG
ncbi:MAG TPA: hypothetical protein VNZ93_05325, partial [Pseudorhodoplanes sp.]|nr:hypothetical protein [Pseudorhodoplanes sp.]